MGYYLFAILPNINNTIGFMLIVATVMAILFTIAIVLITSDGLDDDDFSRFLKKHAKWFYPTYIILGLLNVFIPSQKQLAFIIAAPYIIENEDLQQAGKNTTEIIKLGTEYLKGVLDDSNRTDKNS